MKVIIEEIRKLRDNADMRRQGAIGSLGMNGKPLRDAEALINALQGKVAAYDTVLDILEKDDSYLCALCGTVRKECACSSVQDVKGETMNEL